MTDENIEVEQVEQTELSPVEKIQKMIADKKAAAENERKRLEDMEKEAEALSEIDIDSDVEDMLNTLDSVSKDIKTEQDKMNEELKPLNEQIEVVKTSHKETFDGLNVVYTETMASLVEKVGEVGAKALTSGVTVRKVGSGTGRRGRGGASREQVITAICDEGLTFEQAAIKYDHQGDGERGVGAKQKLGNLVKRHIDLSVKEGTVIKNPDGTYSRA